MFNFFNCLNPDQQAGSFDLILPDQFVEYSHKDPQTKMLRTKIAKFESGMIESHYAQWKRMKFKTKDIFKLKQTIKNGSFIDFDFPHKDESVSNEESVQPIIWKRIPDIVKNPIFCESDTITNFDKVPIPNKILKQALGFIAQTHPSKLKQLLSQDNSEKGIYQFKLFRNGIIENVIIDDYVPTVYGKPLMCGPIRERQTFLMLIEKAMAKICVSYDRIPDQLQSILEMLFCGPLRRTKIEQLSDKENVKKTIENTVANKGVGGFMTKRQPKIRNFGIQENELYTILNHHYVDVEGQGSVFLIEMQGARKFATWNGKFSHNDQIWNKVAKQRAHALFKRLKQNKSFFVPLNDVVRIFDHLIAFDGTEIHNKDWIQATSERDYPSYSTFDVYEEDNVFIRASTSLKTRSILIISRYNGKNDYDYVGGSFHPDGDCVEYVGQLSPGKYIVTVLHDWVVNNTNNYTIFLSSNNHCCLQKSHQTIYSNLIEILFRNHSLNMRKKGQKSDIFSSTKYYSVCNLASEIGLVYMHADISNLANKKLMIKIDEKILQNQRWEVMEPHRNRELIDLDKQGRSDVVIILKNMMFLQDQKRFFPSTAFKIIE